MNSFHSAPALFRHNLRIFYGGQGQKTLPHCGHGFPFGQVSGGLAFGLQLMAGAGGPGDGGGEGGGPGGGAGPLQQVAASADAPLLEHPTAVSGCNDSQRASSV